MISQFFKIKKPTVTTMVNALVHAGFLIKVPSLSDGRSYVLELTGQQPRDFVLFAREHMHNFIR